MYHPTTRVLTVLELLQARARLSGGELAQRLEVDRRTVRRYVSMLQDLGVPVESVPGRAGGYRLRPGYKLPPLMFTEEEALALTLGLLVARRFTLIEASPAIEGALAKVDRVLPDRLRGRVQAVQGALSFTTSRGFEQPSNPATLLTFSDAAQNNQRVWLRHRGSQGEESERMLDPYGVVYHQGRWYVVGWCHLRQDVRTFRLDRVLEVQPLDNEMFARPPDFDCAQFVLQSFASIPYGWPVEVLLELSEEQARRRIPPDFGRLEPARKGVILRTEVDNLEWLARRLVSLDCRFRVLHPPELREALRRLARQIRSAARAPGHPRRPWGRATPRHTPGEADTMGGEV